MKRTFHLILSVLSVVVFSPTSSGVVTEHFEVPALQKEMPQLFLQNLFKRSDLFKNLPAFKRNGGSVNFPAFKRNGGVDFEFAALAAAKDLEDIEKEEKERETDFNRIFEFINQYEKAEND